MTEKEKADLTRTEVGRMLGSEIEKLKAAQAARDAEQDAKLARPSRAMRAVHVSLDITEKYPVASWLVGVCFVAAGLLWLEGVKLYIACGIGVCFVPGLARKVVSLATGLKKAKGE
jgi:hypothetical protein